MSRQFNNVSIEELSEGNEGLKNAIENSQYVTQSYEEAIQVASNSPNELEAWKIERGLEEFGMRGNAMNLAASDSFNLGGFNTQEQSQGRGV